MELVVTAKVKIYPDDFQREQLIQTLKAVKGGLNHASNAAFENGFITAFKKLQTLVYSDLREMYGLKSQMACNVCSVVAGSYASMKSNGEKTLAVYKSPKFQYSYNRDYSFTKEGLLSIGTLDKRIKVAFEKKGLKHYFDGTWEFGTATLIHKKSKFFLHMSVKKEFAPSDEIVNIVGVDLGMRFLTAAIDSKDNHYFASGKHINSVRAKHVYLRKQLQERGTKSAKRKLARLSGKENRFMADVNHCVSKALVRFAGKSSLIVLEDLTNINLSTKVRKKDRYFRYSWAFSQLRQYIEYKAVMGGAQVISVNPRYTSQMCPKCGHTHKDNRNQKIHTFTCLKCGYTSNDDRIGAMNLRQKGIEYHSGIAAQA